ncbi:hypothetical protein MMPV_008371 [Pyropia vietnamensis]
MSSAAASAATAVSRADILHLYRSLLSAGRGFADYNFRAHALRRTAEEFRVKRDAASVPEAYAWGLTQLGVIRRQAAISRMYAPPPTVLERAAPPAAGGS